MIVVEEIPSKAVADTIGRTDDMQQQISVPHRMPRSDQLFAYGQWFNRKLHGEVGIRMNVGATFANKPKIKYWRCGSVANSKCELNYEVEIP